MARRGVEFHHSTYNASKIRQKALNGSVLMGTECLVAFSLVIKMRKWTF